MPFESPVLDGIVAGEMAGRDGVCFGIRRGLDGYEKDEAKQTMKGISSARIAAGALLMLGCSEESPRLEPCTGEYSFAQIQEWFQGPAKDLLTVPGVNFLDADERLNCLMVGVTDESVKADVLEKASELGIPEDAIGFEIEDSPTVASSQARRFSSFSGEEPRWYGA